MKTRQPVLVRLWWFFGALAVCGVMRPAKVLAAEDRCRCQFPFVAAQLCCKEDGRVGVQFAPGRPVAREQGMLGRCEETASEEEERLVRLAFEVWDGTRIEDLRCVGGATPRLEKVQSSQPTPGVAAPLYPLFQSLTGLNARLLVVRGVHVGARICVGPPPEVLVSVEHVGRMREVGGAALLAFVLAHELGHRSSAMTEQGDQCSEWVQEESDEKLESAADARGAFYAALAGYRVRELADAKKIDAYLEEHRVDENKRRIRERGLKRVFEDYDHYVGVYQTGVHWLFLGNYDAAIVLLQWLGEVMKKRGHEVPEVRLAEALAMVMRSGPEGPAFEGRPKTFEGLGCVPVYPERPAMHEEMGGREMLGGLMGPSGRTREDARRELEEAERILVNLRGVGISRLLLESAKACAYYYLGRTEAALAALKEAESELTSGTPKAIREALAANRKKIEFLAKFGARTDWRRVNLAKVEKNFGKECADAVEKALHQKGEEATTPSGSRGSLAQLGVVLPDVPEFPEEVGRCPEAWKLRFYLPKCDEGSECRKAYFGVTGCVPDRGPDGGVAVHVRLMGSSRPPSGRADQVLTFLAKLPEAAQALEAWKPVCSPVQTGTSDIGDQTHLCRTVEGLILLVTDSQGRVKRLVSEK